MQSTKYCLEQFKKSKKIAIITHSNPDADALCSSIALKRLLKKMYDTEDSNLKIDIFTLFYSIHIKKMVQDGIL